QGSPGSSMPLPQRFSVVDVVDVVVGASVEVVVVDAQVHAAVQTSPGAQRNAPPGELGSHGSPGSTMPLPQRFRVVVVVDGVVDVVVVEAHVQAAVQTSPGAQRKAPPGELGSHGSPGSTMPLPQSSGAVVDVVDVVGVVV